MHKWHLSYLKRHFSAAIRNVCAQLVLMNRGLTSIYINANLNAIMAPADLHMSCDVFRMVSRWKDWEWDAKVRIMDDWPPRVFSPEIRVIRIAKLRVSSDHLQEEEEFWTINVEVKKASLATDF